MSEERSEEEVIEALTEDLKLALLKWETPELKQIRESATPENIKEARVAYQAEAEKLDDYKNPDAYLHATLAFGCALMSKQVGDIERFKDELLIDGETDLYAAVRYKFPELAKKIYEFFENL